MEREAELFGLGDEQRAQIGAERREHGNVANLVEVGGLAAVVEGLGSLVRAIDEVVEYDEVAGLVGLAEAAARGRRHDHVAVGVAHGEQIGAIVDLARPGQVLLVVAREEHALDVAQLAAH